jgi:type IV secretion system protein VirB11
MSLPLSTKTATYDARIVEKFMRELGKTIRAALDDERTEDIALNSDGRIWVKRQGDDYVCAGEMLDSHALDMIGTVAYMRGEEVNAAKPILEVDLPVYGARFEAVIPPVVSSPIFSIRTRNKHVKTFAMLLESGIVSEQHVEVIEEAVRMRRNILVAGGTGSGKTTFVNAILEAQSRLTPQHRTILIEDTPELNCQADNVVSLLSSVSVSMLDCLRVCMRLNPDRITVGEVRGAEAHTLIKSWNTGHPGGFATVHADDAYSALLRIQTLVAEAVQSPQQEEIARAINLVVFIKRDKSFKAGRQVTEVCRVTGYRDGRYVMEVL